MQIGSSWNTPVDHRSKCDKGGKMSARPTHFIFMSTSISDESRIFFFYYQVFFFTWSPVSVGGDDLVSHWIFWLWCFFFSTGGKKKGGKKKQRWERNQEVFLFFFGNVTSTTKEGKKKKERSPTKIRHLDLLIHSIFFGRSVRIAISFLVEDWKFFFVF